MASTHPDRNVLRNFRFGCYTKKLAKSYMKSNNLYVPVGFGEELRLFGRRSTWTIIGPLGIDNRLFTFQATNKHDRNSLEYYLGGSGWQRFRKEYRLRTFDSLEFHIIDWRKKAIRVRMMRYHRGG
ncbi:hypothetical protein PIB30_043361 [Stylosanthes scabra]|uniref:TF-B3 domain-containing protein n=1 Tax=Stylosanthes scabra TaxID=79078 RepID=A0ABU6WIA5_9FABA|nr:hypothetical protein [Stylosanthes scabra]